MFLGQKSDAGGGDDQKPVLKGVGTIHYLAVDNSKKREGKRDRYKQYRSVLSMSFKSAVLVPTTHGNSLNKRNDKFGEYIPLGDKDNKQNGHTFFVPYYSRGLATSRDSWEDNYSKKQC